MKLKAQYDSEEDIPEGAKALDLYEERDGKWILRRDAIEGVKTEADVQRVQKSLDEERRAHKEVKSKLSKLGDREIDDVLQTLDEVEELRARVESSGSDEKDEEAIQKRIEAAVAVKVNPLQRKLEEAERKKAEFEEQVGGLSQKLDHSKIESEIQRLAAGKVVPSAMEDVVMRGLRDFEVRDGKVVSKEDSALPGVEPDAWLPEILERYPHYAPASTGAGATGNKGGGPSGSNPFSKKGWNRTQQAQLLSSSPDKAEQYARAAGFKDADSGYMAGKPIEQE